MTHVEFMFHHTLPRLHLIASARLDRNDRAEKESKKHTASTGEPTRLGTTAEMEMIMGASS